MKELSPYFIRRTGVPPSAQPPLLYRPVVEDRSEPGFWDFGRVIKKHRRVIVIFSSIIVVTVSVGMLLMPPIYTSETTLLIEEKSAQVIDIKQVLSDPIGSTDKYDYYETQFEILKSPSLAAQVIEEQRLVDNKLFTGEEKTDRAGALWSSLKSWAQDRSWVPTLRSSAKTEANDPTATITNLTGAYLGYLKVKPVRETRLVRIAFTTPDRDLSAQLANAHAKAYIRQGSKFRALANEAAEQFLEKKLLELKDRVQNSETVLNDYRRNKGIISLNDKENVVVDRLADLNRRLTEAEAEKISLQAQAQLIRQRAFDSLPAVINNPLITNLKAQLSRLEGDYANLSTEYNLGYPPLAQLKSQVQESRKRLRDEIQSVVAGIESAYLAAEARERGLREKMTQQRSAALQLKDASVEYAILAREVDSNNQLYNSVLQRMKEMGVAGEIGSSNVFVVDEAKPPLAPSSRNKARNILLAILIAAMGGVGLAFLLEHLDQSIRRPEDVERYSQLPTLGVVPDFAIGGKASEPSLIDMVEGNGSTNGVEPHSDGLVPPHPLLSLVWESYRSLQTSILLSQAEKPPRVVLFTSGLGGEGKTATVINTAIVFAQVEARVLVIDADLRKPSCHNRLCQVRALGITELLTGQRTLKEVIKPTLMENLFVITGGAVPPNPAKLVGSRKMHQILGQLREEFDYIFIDSPPLIPVSDAVRLSTMVDGVLFVVKGQETTRNVLKDACSRLQYAQAKVLGVVLNGADLKSGDYGYYYRDFYRTTPSPEELEERSFTSPNTSG